MTSITKNLALRHLKQNKSRSILTVLGITVSVVMLTVIFTCAASFAHYYGEKAIYENGNWHFMVKCNYDDAKKYLENDKAVESIGYEKDLSIEEQGYKVYSNKANYLRVGTVVVGDEQYIKNKVTCKYDGAIPKADNEIMVEQSLIDNNDFDWKIGDTVKIAIGARKKGEFVILPIKGDYQFGERFEKSNDENFKIVGILHNNETTQRVSIIRGMSNKNSKNLIAYARLKRVTPFSYSKINGIYNKFGYTDKKKRAFNVGENTYLLASKLAFSIDEYNLNTALEVGAITVVVFAVIFIASFAMIYNSFALSVGDQIKYLGMLSSVGATRKQKRQTLYFEGALLGSIGILLGVITGTVLSFIAQNMINAKISSIITDYSDNIKYTTHISWWALGVIVILSALVIFVSIVSPIKKATQITAVEAIRENNEIKLKGKIRTPFIISKIFGFEGDIAFKNLKRNGRKSRTIIACICVCVILFLSCNYFCDTFEKASNLEHELPYQISFQYSGQSDADLKKTLKFLKENKKIKRSYSIFCDWYTVDTDDFINPYDHSHPNDLSFQNESVFKDKYKFLANQKIFYNVNIINDEDFNALCKRNGIDYKKYYSLDKSGALKAVITNAINFDKEPIFNDNILGKTISIYNLDFEKTERENKLDENGNQIDFYVKKSTPVYKFCDFASYDENDSLSNLNYHGVNIYVPLSVYSNEYIDSNDHYINYGIETDEPTEVEKELKDYLSENDDEGDVYNDYYYTLRQKSIVTLVQFLSYAFILLIALITVFNIINTMTAQIANRKRELAMLKSVGMTPREYKKTILLESLFYALFGLLFGIPASLVINRIVGYIISKNNPVAFSVNVPLYILACIAIFAIIALTMIYSLKLIKNNSIIESLKNDTN